MRYALIALVALAGCAGGEGLGYVLDSYRSVKVEKVMLQGEEWRIYDRGTAFMITPNLARVRQESFQQGLTVGMSGDPLTDERVFRPAAEEYIQAKGCRITGGRLAIKVQYEFDYTC